LHAGSNQKAKSPGKDIAPSEKDVTTVVQLRKKPNKGSVAGAVKPTDVP
jgi:hypothetical protein